MGGFGGRDCCEVLRCAASQGQTAARELDQIACLLRDAVSRTEDLRCLMQADRALERLLSQALWNELALLKQLRR